MLTAQIVQAVDAAGGSANPVSGLWLSSMTGAPPDVREIYTTADGQALHALVYKPAFSNRSAPIMAIRLPVLAHATSAPHTLAVHPWRSLPA
jgi:hypothetical protein